MGTTTSTPVSNTPADETQLPSSVAEAQERFQELSLSNKHASDPDPDLDSDEESYRTAKASQPAQDFPHFPELATELQIEIWQQAILSSPHSDDLGNTSFLFITPRWVGTRSPKMLISPYTKRIVYGHSFVYKERKDIYALMRTCRLSRQMVLEWWIEKLGESGRGYSAEKRETKERMRDVLGELLGQMKGDRR